MDQRLESASAYDSSAAKTDGKVGSNDVIIIWPYAELGCRVNSSRLKP